MSRVKVTVRSDTGATALVAGVIAPFATAAGIPDTDARRLGGVVEALVRFTLDHAYRADPWGEIEVTLESGAGVTSIDVHDWGLPLTSAGGTAAPLPAPLASLADADDLRLINLGGEGKRVTAHVRTTTAQPVADLPLARHERVPHSAAAEMVDGRLRPTIAVHDGRVIGHHAIMTTGDAPAAETGAAVVHSAYRGLGVFGRMF